jgi:exopolyphosphatase / guanosine-5'-triphosphate,3'-diphosphate pyrophosphatase
MRIAVIDLGTNTFNLLVAEKENNGINILINEKISVKLGRGGIGKNTILPNAIERGFDALNIYKKKITSFNVKKTFAIGTSALRSAENSNIFLSRIKQNLNIDVEIVSGEREAELIYLGVRQTIPYTSEPFLIIDIGGGSNEFIIANSENIIWKESFPLGMARLNEKFHPSDPIKPNEIIAFEKYFSEELISFLVTLNDRNLKYIVGAEGAFETFYNIAGYCSNPDFRPEQMLKARSMTIGQFQHIHDLLIHSTTDRRLSMSGIESYRVEMVVPACIFVNYILHKIKTQAILVSPFSLKEGVAWEYFFKR